MTRKDALAAIRFAGYHDDTAGALRAYHSARISRTALDGEWKAGHAERKAGRVCACPTCKERNDGTV